MTNSSLFARTSPGYYKITGLLNLDTVGDYKEPGLRVLDHALQDKSASIVFDLSEAEVQGSAVIALMIGWRREAERLNKALRFVNCPDDLLAIARACGVKEILGCG